LARHFFSNYVVTFLYPIFLQEKKFLELEPEIAVLMHAKDEFIQVGVDCKLVL
jgi:hypothetical protein